MSDRDPTEDESDVFSSIRRLMSNDPPDRVSLDTPEDESDDNLVLSSSLRIADLADAKSDDDEAVDVDAVDDGQDPSDNPQIDDKAGFPVVDPTILDERVAEFEAIVVVDDGQQENDEDPLPWNIPEIDESETVETQEEDSDDAITEDQQEPDADDLMLGAPIDEPPAQEEIAEVDDDPADDTHDRSERDTVTTDDIAEDASDSTHSLGHVDNADEDEEHSAEAEDVNETIVDDLAADDGEVLDENTLRAIVTDIVKQELQGEMGERITRNVRKLIRHEIARALDKNQSD